MPIVLFFLTWIGLSGTDKNSSGMIYETESAYNYIQVLELEGTRYLRLNEGQGIHSIYHPGVNNYHVPGNMYWQLHLLIPIPATYKQSETLLFLAWRREQAQEKHWQFSPM